MKKSIKRMNESEMMMVKAVIDFHPIDRDSVLINKGDMKAPDWSTLLDWEDSFPDWWDEDEDEAIPMKDMKRMERRKATFRKDKGRQTRARDLGYNLSPDMTSGKVKTLLSSNHSDRMYFRGNKAKKKMGKPMTTKTALDLVEQMKWEAEMDREAERKEAERQFMLDELASTTDDLNWLKEREADAKKAISELIAIIYEANNKLQDYQVKMNGLRAGKSYLEDEIRKLEEALKQ